LPALGYRHTDDGSRATQGGAGGYSSSTQALNFNGHILYFNSSTSNTLYGEPYTTTSKAQGHPIRCVSRKSNEWRIENGKWRINVFSCQLLAAAIILLLGFSLSVPKATIGHLRSVVASAASTYGSPVAVTSKMLAILKHMAFLFVA